MFRVHRPFLIALLLLALPLLAACGADNQAEPGSTEDLPDWLTRVYPAPGAETTATRSVQVEYPVTEGREVRLLIDGTDVTTYARVGGGLLEYDVDQPVSPVELRPGSHTATVELYEPSVESSESSETFDPSERQLIDSFTWEFELS